MVWPRIAQKFARDSFVTYRVHDRFPGTWQLTTCSSGSCKRRLVFVVSELTSAQAHSPFSSSSESDPLECRSARLSANICRTITVGVTGAMRDACHRPLGHEITRMNTAFWKVTAFDGNQCYQATCRDPPKLPGDDIRQILSAALRRPLRPPDAGAIDALRPLGASLQAGLAEGARNSHEWTDRKNEQLKAFDEAGITAAFMEPEEGGSIAGPGRISPWQLIAFELAWVDAALPRGSPAGSPCPLSDPLSAAPTSNARST